MEKQWPRRTHTRLATLLTIWLALVLLGCRAFAHAALPNKGVAIDSPRKDFNGTDGGTSVSDNAGGLSNANVNDYSLNDQKPCIPPLKRREINDKPLATCDENNCCLSCPFVNNFYEEGVIDQLYKTFGAFGIAGFFLMLFLVATFALLPSVKENPTARKLLLPFAMSVCFFLFQDFFTVQQRKTQCLNEFEQATSSHTMCAAQAIFTLAGAYGIACWSALLIVHLHLLSVWRSDFIIRHIGICHVIIAIVTVLSAVLPLSLNRVTSGNICFISQSASNLFYVPLSFIYVVFILHLVTFAYMANVSIRANNRHNEGGSVNSRPTSFYEAQRRLAYVRQIFRLQWRALVGCVLMLIVYIIDVIYYVFKYQPPPSSLGEIYVKDWLSCLREGGSQNECSARVKHEFPSVAFVMVFLFFNCCTGILIFLIFAVKRRYFTEWIDLIWNRDKPTQARSFSRATYFSEGARREIRSEKSQSNRTTLQSITTQGELDAVDARRKSRAMSAPYNNDDTNTIEDVSLYLPPPPRITPPGGDRNTNREKDEDEGENEYSINMGMAELSSPQGGLSPPPSPTVRKMPSYTRASSVLVPQTPNLRSSFGTEATEHSSLTNSPAVTALSAPELRSDVEDTLSSLPPPIQNNGSMARASFGVLDTPSPTEAIIDSMLLTPSNHTVLAIDNSVVIHASYVSEGDAYEHKSDADEHESAAHEYGSDPDEYKSECIDDEEVFGRSKSRNGKDAVSDNMAYTSTFVDDDQSCSNIIDCFPMPQSTPGGAGTPHNENVISKEEQD